MTTTTTTTRGEEAEKEKKSVEKEQQKEEEKQQESQKYQKQQKKRSALLNPLEDPDVILRIAKFSTDEARKILPLCFVNTSFSRALIDTSKEGVSDLYLLDVSLQDNDFKLLLRALGQNLTHIYTALLSRIPPTNTDALLGKWDRDGRNALHLACSLDCSSEHALEVVKQTVAHGCVVEHRDSLPTVGFSALDYAMIVGNHINVVEYLLKQSPALRSLCDDDGMSPLHNAARHGKIDCARLLLNVSGKEKKKEQEEKEKQDLLECVDTCAGATPAMYAAECGQLEMLKMLVEEFGAKADSSVKNKQDQTMLHRAARNGHGLVLDYLLSGINNNSKNNKTKKNSLPSFSKEDVNHQDVKGYTALHHAVEFANSHSAVRVLCEVGGADPELRTKNTVPLTAFDMATKNEETDYRIPRLLMKSRGDCCYCCY